MSMLCAECNERRTAGEEEEEEEEEEEVDLHVYVRE